MSLKKSVEAEIMSQIFEIQNNPDKWKVLILDRLTTLILFGMQLPRPIAFNSSTDTLLKRAEVKFENGTNNSCILRPVFLPSHV